MASTSDPPAAGGSEEAILIPTETAVAPSADPPPPPLSSSKRRWSPCTWRYAIEEVQPELGSRPRSGSSNAPHSSSSLRASVSSDHAALPALSKSRPLHSHDHAVYAKDSEEPVRRSIYANRPWPGAELSELRSRHAQTRTHDMMAKKKRPPHPQQPHQQHQQKEPSKRLKDEEEEDGEADWDDDDDGGGDEDAERGYQLEDSKKRKRREMSPSELYFCEICRAKAMEASKQSSSPESPLPLQDR